MGDNVSIKLSVTPTWSILQEMQAKTEKHLRDNRLPDDIIEAAIMCASELLENAIKYGAAVNDKETINFALHTDAHSIQISISNGIKSENDKNIVRKHIDSIKQSDDPAQLYIDRLTELMNNPKPGVSQLGLLRIAYEAEFKLDCSFENDILTISAVRKI